MDPSFWEFCKSNGAAGVLLIALAGVAKIMLPRLDRIIDFYLKREEENANLKPQLDKIEAAQKDNVCRFTACAGATSAAAAVASTIATHGGS